MLKSDRIGGGKETRTPDPHAASVMLYQLSYAPRKCRRPGDPPVFTPASASPLVLYYASEVRWAIARCSYGCSWVRKVRASSGKVQDNVLSGRLEGKCHRNIPPRKVRALCGVRVKS